MPTLDGFQHLHFIVNFGHVQDQEGRVQEFPFSMTLTLLYQTTFTDQSFCTHFQGKKLTGFCELTMALMGDAPSPLPVPSVTDVINDLPGYILRAVKARSEQLIKEAE